MHQSVKYLELLLNWRYDEDDIRARIKTFFDDVLIIFDKLICNILI